MEIHRALLSFLTKDHQELNKLLFELDEARHQHEEGDTSFLCNNGACSATDDEKGKPDGYISHCFFCGGELEIYKGNYYHYSAFNDRDKFLREYTTYQTHNYEPLEHGVDATSEEEEINKNADRYCTMHDFFTSEGDCGFKNCRDYEPKNGKNGMCVHKTFSYTKTGRKFKLTKDEFVEIKETA